MIKIVIKLNWVIIIRFNWSKGRLALLHVIDYPYQNPLEVRPLGQVLMLLYISECPMLSLLGINRRLILGIRNERRVYLLIEKIGKYLKTLKDYYNIYGKITGGNPTTPCPIPDLWSIPIWMLSSE